MLFALDEQAVGPACRDPSLTWNQDADFLTASRSKAALA
jgi:hypothetical protein